MSVKPSYLDPKYNGLNPQEHERQYDRDKMIWEQTEALNEANRLKDEELHGKPEYHNPLDDYKKDIDNIIEKDENEELYGVDEYEEEYEKTEEDIICDKIREIKDKYARLSMQKDNLKNLAESERSEIGGTLGLFIGIIVAVVNGPFHEEWLLYGIGAFGGTYIIVNLIHIWLKSLAKNKIVRVKNKQKEMRQQIKEFEARLDELDEIALKEMERKKSQ